MIIPQCIRPGDRIAILSPASVVNPDYIDGAARLLAAEGFEPVVMPHAKGPASGSFAAGDADRVADMTAAWRDPSVRAILCARGGYGCNHLIDKLPVDMLLADPKWLIGFSDISALHALCQHAGIVSLHAPMAKHLTEKGAGHYCTETLLRILTDGLPVEYMTPHDPRNTCGDAGGMLIGGNLAVINGLAATPYDPLALPGRKILFIEDIGEQIYEVERMLIRLRLSGLLKDVAGILVGSFTQYNPDRNHPDMETMIARLFGTPAPCPIAFGFKAGHTDDNLPLPLGAGARLTVAPEGTILTLCAEQEADLQS